MTRPWIVGAILALQFASALFFVADLALPLLGLPVILDWRLHESIEILAALGLILGVVSSAMLLRRALRAQALAEARLKLASAAFHELVEMHFTRWGLTPAERDVGLFAVKGLSLDEIAALRGTSAGTVKAQTAAIYRKAGVSGRAQLLSVFIEELMDRGAPSEPPAAEAEAEASSPPAARRA